VLDCAAFGIARNEALVAHMECGFRNCSCRRAVVLRLGCTRDVRLESARKEALVAHAKCGLKVLEQTWVVLRLDVLEQT
jgi:hypothetical protein